MAVAATGIAVSIVGCQFSREEHTPPMVAHAESSEMPFPSEDVPRDSESGLDWHCSAEGLDAGLRQALRRVAEEYQRQTGKTIAINSGRRTLRHQARLMAAMTRKQLEGMYCRGGYPSYIRDIVLARERREQVSAAETYLILRDRTEGYISSHLSGAAVDISSHGADVALLESLLAQHGFSVLDERSLGVQCIHATFLAAPKHIVRE